ncbi:hypothetical protein QR680_013603 [Steinernema hermaphroditum]|uniref:Peptidase S1 domain-containing protein n=1 Tax=Steinernema hermaphroditum TaxID=289476 RepID=A0AA39I7N6_9BILA|nr:hypothetical protein QR680_013603 [Steinernema hermaphroditum]
MANLLLLLPSLFVLLGAAPTPSSEIVGGAPAEVGYFPWFAYLKIARKDGNFHECGGTLLNERFVLTAAHCVNNTKENGQSVAYFGIVHSKDIEKRGVVSSPISAVRMTPKNPNTSPYDYEDIAVLKLSKPVPFSNNVSSIGIKRVDTALVSAGREGVAAGYGTTNGGLDGQVSERLLYVYVPFATPQLCHKTYGEHTSKRLLCAGARGHGAGPGDSGAPFVAYDDKGAYLVGVVSGGLVPNEKGQKPDYYTRTSSFCTFIEQKTEKTFKCS